MGTRMLRVVGRAHPTEWHERTYDVLLEEEVSPGSVGMRLFGYTHRSAAYPDEDRRTATGKAWIVRTLDGRVFISSAGSVNSSREGALYLAMKALEEEAPAADGEPATPRGAA